MIRAALFLLFLAAPAMAQDWRVFTSDDGSFFYGAAQGPGLTLECGGRSPRGLDPMVTGNVEPSITAPFSFNLIPADAAVGNRGPGPLSDVTLQTGQAGYYLPALMRNELNGTWEQPIAMTDQLVITLRNEGRTILTSPGIGATEVPTRGMRAAIDQVVAYCGGLWAQTGHAVPLLLQGGAAPPPAAPPPSDAEQRLINMVNADLAEACAGGQASLSPDALQRGDFDGDGQQDILLFWRDVTCITGPNVSFGSGAGFCGAAACSGSVYLSTRPVKRDSDLLALGASVLQRPDGGADIVAYPSLSVCNSEFGTTSCTHRFRWNGGDFQRVY